MSSPLISSPIGKRQGFTLIELLTVIAIIGILAAITFGAMRSVKERSKINQVRVEMSALATALENYKRQYGDYPQTGGETLADPESNPSIGSIDKATHSQAAFFNALAGKLGPKLALITGGKVFLELSKFTLETDKLPLPNDNVSVDNALLDPWGRRYIYIYKDRASPNTWKAPGYLLLSAGPDGVVEDIGDIKSDGILLPAFLNALNSDNTAGNPDNIYFNR